MWENGDGFASSDPAEASYLQQPLVVHSAFPVVPSPFGGCAHLSAGAPKKPSSPPC